MKKHREIAQDILTKPIKRWMCKRCGGIHQFEAIQCSRCDSIYVEELNDACFANISTQDIGWKARRLARVADIYGQPVRAAAENPKLLSIAGLEDENITESVIIEAQRLDRELADSIRNRIERIHTMTGYVPPLRNSTSTKSSTAQPSASTKPEGKRVKIYGHSVTAVIRWMGSKEWSYDDALKVLKHFGINVVKVTITSQLHIGSEGIVKLGEPARLTPEQANDLFKISSDTTAIVSPPQPKPESRITKVQSTELKTKRKGQTILGHSATAVIRWMGTKDWTIDQVNQVLKEFEINLSPITVKVNLTSGTGEGINRGDPAKLTPEQANELAKI